MERVLRKNPVVTLMLKAVLVSFIVSAILLLLTSAMMLNMDLSAAVVSVLVIVTYIVSNLLSGLIVGKGMEQKRFLWGMLSGLVYFVILFLFSMVFAGLRDFNVVATIRTLVICVFSGMIGGMIS